MIKWLFMTLMSVSFVEAKSLPELTFSSATEVSPRSVLTAFDIVEAKNLNDETASELKQIVVGDEKTSRIVSSELARQLRHLKAKFMLPTEVKIMRSSSQVSRMEVERKIRNQLQMHCSECEIRIQISSVPSQLASDWNLDLNIDLNKSTLLIPIFSVSQPDRKGWVSAEVKRYQQIPVLNRALKTSDVITQDVLSLEKRFVSSIREVVLNTESLVGMQVVRYMNAGQSFLFSDLKKENVVQRGQIIKAMMGNDTFEVSISAQVEESGAIGDVIKVKNLDSQKVFSAKVIERGLVRIE